MGYTVAKGALRIVAKAHPRWNVVALVLSVGYLAEALVVIGRVIPDIRVVFRATTDDNAACATTGIARGDYRVFAVVAAVFPGQESLVVTKVLAVVGSVQVILIGQDSIDDVIGLFWQRVDCTGTACEVASPIAFVRLVRASLTIRLARAVTVLAAVTALAVTILIVMLAAEVEAKVASDDCESYSSYSGSNLLPISHKEHFSISIGRTVSARGGIGRVG